MSKPADDLEAVRAVVEAVQGFKEDEQQRIFRWAAEKLGLKSPFGVSAPPVGAAAAAPGAQAAAPPPPAPSAPAANGQDIRSFVASKNPRSDVQFAATVAYYYQFAAPQAERKQSINGDDLQNATRMVGRDRLKKPIWTLQNARNLGLLDKAEDPGAFSINTVGENLVAMTLPGDGNGPPRAKRASKAPAKKSPTKKGPRKKG
jgi:hypothetical protein